MIREFWQAAMRHGVYIAIVVISLACGSVIQAQTQNQLPPQLRDVGIDQKLDVQLPLDATFRDEDGQEVQLGKYFHDKPVILVLVYYSCPRLCTRVLTGLLDGLEGLTSMNVGEQFEVVTISFDPREKPDLAAKKKAAYLASYGRTGAAAGWHFLTGDNPAIKQLTEAVGFRYVYDPGANQFAHASGILILTPHGKIARYFYGIEYPPSDLRLGLVEASENKIGTPVDQILLFCFHYDPETGKYGPAIMNIVRLMGVLTVVGLGVMFFLLWRRERRSVTPVPLAKGI